MSTWRDDGKPIRARVNPIFMIFFMALHLIWIIVVPFAFLESGAIVFVLGCLMFVAPPAAVVANFVWHYRLELTTERLSIHRYFRWGGRSMRIEDISGVVVKPGLLGAPRVVFESAGGDIELMWRGQRGNFWPPVILDRMLVRLANRGVTVDPEVREYLANRAARVLQVSKGVAAVLLIVLLAPWPILMALMLSIMSGEWWTGPALVLALAGAYGLFGAVLWLNDRHYGDLPDSDAHGCESQAVPAGQASNESGPMVG